MKRQDARDAKELREPDEDLDRFASDVIDAAVEVHRELGPGFLESVYERALCIELRLRALPYRRQVSFTVGYKGERVGESCLELMNFNVPVLLRGVRRVVLSD